MRHALALHIAPLLLRVGLGLTFLWAGAAKLTQQMPVTPDNRAQLAAWGVIEGVPQVEQDIPDPTPDPEQGSSEDPSPPAGTPDLGPEDPPSEADELIDPDADAEPADEQAAASPNASLVAFQAEPDESVRRVYGLALLIHASANPMPNDDGSAAMPLWPPAFASDKLPVYFAWGAAVTELIAGIAVLFGFFARLGALPLAGTMCVAMWLTQIGPALQSGNTTLGFLPVGMFDLGAGGYVYTQLLWQVALLLMAGALFCLGPGFFSIDRLLFGPIADRPGTYSGEGEGDDVEFVPMPGRKGIRPGADA